MIATKERPKTASKERISTTHPLTEEKIAQYHEDGFVIVRGFFDPQEVEAVRIACEEDPELGGQETEFTDSQGNTSRIAHWTELGDSLLGVIPRLARIVNAAETFLGGECYHWHSKLVKKRPRDEGSFDWHQLFGGVYIAGCLFPDMSACFIAIDSNTRENGCVEVVKKSHLMGRLETANFGEGWQCDPKRMEKVLARLEVVHCEMEPGDTLWTHANTIHASRGNHTDKARTNIICHHNAIWNEPFVREGLEHRAYRPLSELPDSTILEGNYKGVFENHEFLGKQRGYQQIIKRRDMQ